MKKHKKNKASGITLIALVVTIIVLLILAGISTQMLSGDNGILTRAGQAKEVTDIAQIEEAIKLEYFSLLGTDILNYGNSATVKQAIENIMTKDEYKDKIVKKNGGSGSITLSANSVIVGATSPNNIATITIEEGSSDGEYYAVSSGKYYKILTDSDDLKIDRTPTEFSEDDTSSGGGATKVIVADTTKATASLSDDKKTITITGVAAGNTSITVEGINKTATIEVVSSITDVNLDGAIIPGTLGTDVGNTTLSFTSDKITQGDESIATVTSEGIIKCGSKTGTTTVKIDGTAYRVKSTARVVATGTNKTINGSTTGTATNPIIPTGFTAIDTGVDLDNPKRDGKINATWNKESNTQAVEKGLVIMDSKGNQFVWIPVSDPTTMYGTLSKGKKAGKLYTSWSGTGNSGTKSSNNWTETGGVMSITFSADYREPATVSSYDNGQTYTPTGASETKTYLSIITDVIKTRYKSNNEYDNMTNFGNTMQDDFDKMIRSVIVNGGFYIGRYEASLINNETRVLAGATSMSAEETSVNRWYGLYARQRNFADDNGLTSVDSSMIWGCQYDAIINWMQNTGTDVTTVAKSRSSIDGTARNADTNRRTGVVAKDKLNNIYDILGLRREWTMEADGTGSRVYRGGSYNDYYSPSNRLSSYPYNAVDSYGSRPSLYIE